MIFRIATLVFGFCCFGLCLCEANESVWDVENEKRRKAIHQYLIKEFAKNNDSKFSTNRKRLDEVVVYKGKVQLTQTTKFDLAKGTHLVTSMFDQVVVKGQNLNRIKAAFSIQKEGTFLRQFRVEDDNLAVFAMLKMPLPTEINSKIERGDDESKGKKRPELALVVHCNRQDSVVIEEILIRKTGGLPVEFTRYQESVFQFSNDSLDSNMQFLVETRERSVEELSTSLNENTRSFDKIVNPATMGAGILQDFKIHGILVDRRVAKLYEHLSRLDSAAAALQAAEWFDQSFENYKAKWKDSELLPDCELYAPHAQIFLCSEFGGADLTMARIDEWNRWHQTNVSKGYGFERTAGIDALFTMNIKLNLIKKKSDWSINELNAFLINKLGVAFTTGGGDLPPQMDFKPLHASDWTSKQDDIVAIVPTFSNSSSLIDPGRQELLLKTLADELSQ